ncbi:tetratricopeptide repeat protein 19 homolog, mitochondrial isoform X2 [Odontomachus brunneus]|uniref:tetratricopeptide repeat protein 19 homolog, mitochondrial isoform X2 n=1 Tax=Odontomachus brunneus TaxID=486640 RepID=UPI0013F19F3D|nr:tetratricopeptide repeat protein 19 homolog, mitochondrial isoform X2 [Odontomachus brunneus]
MQHLILIPRTLKYVLSNIGFRTVASTSRNVIYNNNSFVKLLRPFRLYVTKKSYYDNRSQEIKKSYLAMYMFSLFSYFFHDDEEEDKEVSAIIKTIKQSVLLIQKNEFMKAEQMLHIALHQAQTIQHYNAITYIYDIMANLAFDTGDYHAAETLFTTVLQRLMSKGILESDLKVIHISLKMAKMFEFKREMKKSEQGYLFCIGHLYSCLKEDLENIEAEKLLLLSFRWYAEMLTQNLRYTEAYDYYLQSYNLCKKLYSDDNEKTVVVLNELGYACYMLEKYDEAMKYFSAALELGKNIPDLPELCALHVNLGNTFLKKGLYNEAKKFCLEGRKIAKQNNDNNGLYEADVCLEEIKKLLL